MTNYISPTRRSDFISPFSEDDVLEVDLYIDNGVLEESYFIISADECFHKFRKSITSFSITKKGVHELGYVVKLKTKNPEIDNELYKSEGKIFMAITKDGLKLSLSSTKDNLQYYLDHGSYPPRAPISRNNYNPKHEKIKKHGLLFIDFEGDDMIQEILD